ncbi:light protein [Nesidiocoris tenuis]|uniref:Light protein n=1 Tax=Nesidiocoris tenuis TaxID=355587 RepID=A0ABN7AL08_9HEMI|nr:light protein [Nesidiocoris tenuis]
MQSSVQESEDQHAEDGDECTPEEKEPKLKYSRMVNDLLDILKKDSTSCVAVHPKFVCVGTDWGFIHLLDHQGNNVNRELRAHTVAINQISIDANGDHIASCSDDGRVLVLGLYNAENNQDINMERLVRSVAIDPFFYKPGSGRRFITGDERLILHEKKYFSRWKQTILGDASVEGGVKTMKWSPGGEFLAWASHVGFRVYDLASRSSLGLLKWPSKINIDLKCHICWKNNFTVIIGWGDMVKVCAILEKATLPPLDVSKYYIQLVFSLPMDYIVCGVGPLDNNIVVFGCAKGPNGMSVGERPSLQVIQPAPEGFADLGIDFLSLRGFAKYTASDYSLECLPDEGRFVIVSPKDVVVACSYDTDDRVDWLLLHKKYQTALDAIESSEKPLERHTTWSVGQAFIDHLLEQKMFEEAAILCSKIVGADKIKWEQEIRKFANANQLRSLADYLPTSYDSALAAHNYEMVLYEYLRIDSQGFLEKIKQWPPRLYNVQAVANSTLEHILHSESKSNPILLEALAVLYSHMGKHDKAVSMYIKLQNKGVFELIKQHKLYWAIDKSAKELMKLDNELAIETLLETETPQDRTPIIDPQKIVDILADNNYYLYLYLDALDRKNTKECRRFHSGLVKLYADFAKDKLLGFLKKSDHYPIQEALDICQQRKFHEETVHLLDIIGSTKEALVLILKEIKDFERAVEFCKEHDDTDLWEDLINYSMDKPSYITTLLRRMGTNVDPRILVERINFSEDIPMLKESLAKMMHDYSLQVSIQEGCNNIMSSDYFDLHERLITTRQKGFAVRKDHICGVCDSKLLENLKVETESKSIVIFQCSHSFHSDCLYGSNRCPMCLNKTLFAS